MLTGAVAGVAAAAVSRPQAARAADDQPVVLGQVNSATRRTAIANTTGTDTNVTLAGPGYGIISNSHVTEGEGIVGSVTGSSGRGVVGETSGHWSQIAVDGDATFGNGEGIGIRGSTNNGTALYGQALGPGGYGLYVIGPAVFNRSGRTILNAGQSSKSISGHSIAAATIVVATIQGDVSGTWVRSVSLDTKRSKFTIRLNKRAPKRLVVGWFIVN